jgi:hypothetical protein
MSFSRAKLSLMMLVGLVLSYATSARAQQSSTVDKSLIQAALIVRVFDQLSAQCQSGQGFNAQQSALITTWEREQSVAGIRNKLNNGTIPSDQKTRIEQGATTMVETLQQRTKGTSPCLLATKLIDLPMAKFATGGSESSNSRNPRSGEQPVSATPINVSTLVASIDSFGFDTSTSFGIGGFMTQDVYPVVLFRNGEALKDIKGLAYPGGLDAHRRTKPEKWTTWRRNGKKIELQTQKGWSALPFTKTYSALPNQFRLNGTYRSLSGSGNVAIGGSSSVAVWRNYTFTSEGGVVRSGSAGGSSENVAVSSIARNQRGRYEIDGLVLRIRYDDGSTEERIIVTDPENEESAIWLNGDGYTKRKMKRR